MKQSDFMNYFRYLAGRLGTAGILGVAMLVAAALLWFFQIRVQQQQLDQLIQKQMLNSAALLAPGRVMQQAQLNDEQRLDAFFRSLPASTEVPSQLRNVYAQATRSGLTLETGEYAVLDEPGSRLRSYKVTLPIKGDARAILSFIGLVQKSANNTALENVSFKRDKIDESQLEAKLVFRLFTFETP